MIAQYTVAVDMRTLLDRKNFSSSCNGQVAAHRVTVASVCPLSFTNENNRIANVYFYFVLEINFFELKKKKKKKKKKMYHSV